jgi:hypothetical protein
MGLTLQRPGPIILVLQCPVIQLLFSDLERYGELLADKADEGFLM